ncbi:MAG: thioredoxin [Desulfobacterales bacterium CG23_combo_of_CG06-09_8_20_14_all_51_8]|nr:MAG: thioredoxin [Desulfobacterales bacterium CG23_combo_of_CG06-09_8_20_14_all_51_8]
MTQDMWDWRIKVTSKVLRCLFFSWVVFILPAWAAQESVLRDVISEAKDKTPASFYKEKKQGWYWYQKDPEKKKPEDPSKRKLPNLEDYTAQELWDMYPDDFQELLNTFMKKAVQAPNEKTVMDYLVMQDIARRKSLAFASVMSYVDQKNQELGTQSVYPITAPGQSAVVSMRVREQEETIASGREQFGLIMFTRQGCDFCESQKSILEFFVNKYGWPVRFVDMDEHPNMAAKFDVTMTPTMIMVDKQSGKSMPISVGVISMSDLALKLYRSIRYMRGEITPQQWFMHDFEKGKSNDPLKYTSQIQ